MKVCNIFILKYIFIITFNNFPVCYEKIMSGSSECGFSVLFNYCDAHVVWYVECIFDLESYKIFQQYLYYKF